MLVNDSFLIERTWRSDQPLHLACLDSFMQVMSSNLAKQLVCISREVGQVGLLQTTLSVSSKSEISRFEHDTTPDHFLRHSHF